MQLGNGHWETAAYNNRLQVTQIGLGKVDNAQDLLKLEYNYGTALENNGSLREQKITVPTVGAYQGFTATQTYDYDSLNRLQSAEEKVSSSTTWKQTFSYDRYGNRRFDALNTTTLGSCAQTQCNPLINTSDNRFSTGQGYSYDENGNVTQDAENQRFGYDAENHQTAFFRSTNNSSTADATYQYDGEGKRVKKTVDQTETIFVYDGGGQLIAEYSNQIIANPQVSYLTTDHLGSPRVITDANGNVTSRKDYSAFGDETVTSQRISELGYQPKTVRQDYTGYQKDEESQLEFAQARYYNTSHGRFTSVDPLTASATIKDPQTFNRYSYVLNSPYKFTDPLGLIGVYAGACGSWCQGSGPYLDGSDFRGTDDPLDWAREYYGNVVGFFPDERQNESTITLKVRILDPKNLLNEKQLSALKDEISSIYKDINVTVNFAKDKEDYRLIVTKDAEKVTQSEDSFGSTPFDTKTKEVFSYGYIFVNRIKELAKASFSKGLQVETEFNRNSDKNLGIALGRAGSHEIGHYLLQLSRHGSEKGVMNRNYQGLDWFAQSTRNKWYFTKTQKETIINKLTK